MEHLFVHLASQSHLPRMHKLLAGAVRIAHAA
jgi:hypothetical protein